MKTKKTDLIEVKLTDIVLANRQPRTIFDEEAIQELAESVKTHGIIQPILLRKKGDKLELVAGERRFRAGKLAGLDVLPALVRELTDDQALEAQIIENVQRKDMHPIEEAVSFKALMDFKKFDVHEISKRVGKSVRYVGLRLKLNELIPEFQKAFFKNRLSLVTAERICRLSPDSQKELWDEEDLQEKDNSTIEVSDREVQRYLCDLTDAPFDTRDPELNKAMGACSACPHNSAASTSLFPDQAHQARCMNAACFKLKSTTSYELQLQQALLDPGIELVSDEWTLGKKGKALVNKGHQVRERGTGYTAIDKPEVPDLAEFREDLEDGVYDTEQEMQEAYDDAVKEYYEGLKEYEEKIASGKFVKAFVVEGDDAGKYTYITIKKDTASKPLPAAAVDNKVKEGTITADEINGEIKRIQEKEKRNKELDAEKINVQYCELLKKNKMIPTLTAPLKICEKTALLIMLADYAGYTGEKIFKIAGARWSYGEDVRLYQRLLELTENQIDKAINQAVRTLFASKLTGQATRPEVDGKAAVLADIIRTYETKAAITIVNNQEKEAKIRSERMEKRIAGLKDQLKEAKSKKSGSTKVEDVKLKNKPSKGIGALAG